MVLVQGAGIAAGVPPAVEEIRAVGVVSEFPKLLMEVLQGDVVVRTIELDDPRERYIRRWLAQSAS